MFVKFSAVYAVICLLISATHLQAQSPSSQLNAYQTRAKQSEARLRLQAIYSELQSEYSKSGKFTEKNVQEYIKSDYFSTTAKHGPLYKVHLEHEKCAKCGVNSKKFKIAAVGNIDDDETLDIWTIDQDKNLVNISNDLKL